MLLATLTLAVSACAAAEADLSGVLETVRAKHGLPALGAAVLKGGKVVAIGAVGKRRLGDSEAVTVDDRWHLGSLTKAMTATLVARLVERGRLRWDMTLGEAFPAFAPKMHAGYRAVTLERLLTHFGGVPADVPPELWSELWRMQGTPTEQRLTLVRGLAVEKPGPDAFLYSNAGYALAGAMAEAREEKPWETLLKIHVLAPLGMTSTGFRAPEGHHPWGHAWRDGKAVPVPPGPQADNPPGIAPAGAVHATLRDWAKFALLHLEGAQGKARLLRPQTFSKLHMAPLGQVHGMGWIIVNRPWAGGRALTHAGSNTMWYAVVWLAPEKDFGVLVATNLGGGPAEKAADEAAAALIEKWCPR
ncbi:class A beta-lactamase-related serine hydrolase [bacterium]|nr:MAG: class A beta-lactamase-related serine hydrolase [bacterium]